METKRMDRIALRGVRVFARHGANPGERDHEQAFEIDVILDADLSRAIVSDEIDDTVHYGDLHARVATAVRERSHALLERVAADVLDAVFEDERIARATVTVAKPSILDGATPSVTLTRENSRYRDAGERE